MGILDINPTLKKHDPNISRSVNADKFYGTIIYVDSYRWLYANMSVAHNSVIMETDVLNNEPDRAKSFRLLIQIFLDFYIKWVSLRLYPVIIFDGPSAPEKCVAHKKRNKAKMAIKEKINEFKNKMATTDPLLKPDPTAYKKALCQNNWLSKDEIAEFKQLVKILGIPYLLAKGEAEKLGSSLCIEGKGSALFTTDTDPLVYGCPSTVVDLRAEGTTLTGSRFSITEIICTDAYKALGLTKDQFVDYCIMLSCDYSDRISGYGPAKCLGLIKKYGSIENIGKEAGLDISVYNHQFCREEFKYVPSQDLIVEGSISPDLPDQILCNNFLLKYSLLHYLEKIIRCNNSIPKEISIKSVAIPGKPKLNLMGRNDGNVNVNMGGNVNVNMGGNVNIKMDGNTNVNMGGNVNVNMGGNVNVNMGGNVNVNMGGNVNNDNNNTNNNYKKDNINYIYNKDNNINNNINNINFTIAGFSNLTM